MVNHNQQLNPCFYFPFFLNYPCTLNSTLSVPLQVLFFLNNIFINEDCALLLNVQSYNSNFFFNFTYELLIIVFGINLVKNTICTLMLTQKWMMKPKTTVLDPSSPTSVFFIIFLFIFYLIMCLLSRKKTQTASWKALGTLFILFQTSGIKMFWNTSFLLEQTLM